MMFGVDGRFNARWFRGPEYQQRAHHAKQLRIFLRKVGLNAPSVNRFLIGAIEEGGATWDDQQKIVTIDYRHADGPAYRIKFRDDGSWRTLPLENNGVTDQCVPPPSK